MDLRGFGSYVVGGGIVAALVACGGGTNNGVVPAARSDHVTNPHQRTFHYVDKGQSFKVPAGVTSLTVVALGAAGGGGAYGGRVFAVIPVMPGEKLYVYVGGEGAGTTGGFNGGGSGGSGLGIWSGDGGGGASDVREHGRNLGDRIIVAGGAGGVGGRPKYGGGGGSGGTQNAGGSGGSSGEGSFYYGEPGVAGSLGVGGSGGAGENAAGGGGGGGGYYGGGGGGGGGSGSSEFGLGGGGGGGSSHVESYATRSRMWQGWYTASGNGLVVFSW